MSIVFMEMDVSCFACSKWTTFLVTFNRWITVIYSNMIWYWIIATVNFLAYCAHVTVCYLFDVFLIATPAWNQIHQKFIPWSKINKMLFCRFKFNLLIAIKICVKLKLYKNHTWIFDYFSLNSESNKISTFFVIRWKDNFIVSFIISHVSCWGRFFRWLAEQRNRWMQSQLNYGQLISCWNRIHKAKTIH